jgi:hypothetical protein
MKVKTAEIRSCFADLIGTRPWRVKLGYGSFLTFEFGAKIRAYGFVHGESHLWIYLANWTLFHGPRRLVDSDDARKVITAGIRRLSDCRLIGVVFEGAAQKTVFVFETFRLEVTPADYLDAPDERDQYWMLFMPGNEVLSLGPAGIRTEAAAVQHA